jgi:hypothetical protein
MVQENPSRAAISEILNPVCLETAIVPRSKSFRSLVLPILTFNQTGTEILDVCLPALYSKPRPRDSLSVEVIHFCEQGVPNKLSGEWISFGHHIAKIIPVLMTWMNSCIANGSHTTSIISEKSYEHFQSLN